MLSRKEEQRRRRRRRCRLQAKTHYEFSPSARVCVFMMTMKSEISFVWHVSNLTLSLCVFRVSFISALTLLFSSPRRSRSRRRRRRRRGERRKSFLTYYHRAINLSLSLSPLFAYVRYGHLLLFLIRFKNRKLERRSQLQAEICFSCNEKNSKTNRL